MRTLAIDIGGTKLAMAVFDGERILQRHRTATDRNGGRPWMLQEILRVARAWQSQFQPQRCGIGFGGPVNFDLQRVARSMHVEGWSDFPLSQQLGEELNLPAVMDNDANVGALGEARYGAGRDFSPLLYMTISTGIGGGIVLDGRIYRGADCNAGEIGHMPVRLDGPPCLCGASGCLERLCSGLWLQRDHGHPAEQLFRDPTFVARYVVDLGAGIRSALMLLNPARVVIGGGISKAGDRLFVPLRQEVARQMGHACRCRIDLVPAALGDDSVLYGAMALAVEKEP